MNKQKFIIALQSKINLLQSRCNDAQNKKQFVNVIELDVKIKAYTEILSSVINGTFDK